MYEEDFEDLVMWPSNPSTYNPSPNPYQDWTHPGWIHPLTPRPNIPRNRTQPTPSLERKVQILAHPDAILAKRKKDEDAHIDAVIWGGPSPYD